MCMDILVKLSCIFALCVLQEWGLLGGWFQAMNAVTNNYFLLGLPPHHSIKSKSNYNRSNQTAKIKLHIINAQLI